MWGEWRVALVYEYTFAGTVAMYVTQQAGEGRYNFLGEDGVIHTCEEGTKPPADPIRLPEGALESLRDALNSRLGEVPSTTEARVLRESLDIERARVDKIIDYTVRDSGAGA